MKLFIFLVCRIVAWSLSELVVVLSLVPPNLRPETPVSHNLEHFVIFAATGWAFGMGYRNRPRVIMVSLVAFAAAVELAQKAVPGRHARLSDFVVDAAALVVAYAVGATMAELIERWI